jgi:hypothetical protein
MPFDVRSAVLLFDRLNEVVVIKLRSEGIPAALRYR